MTAALAAIIIARIWVLQRIGTKESDPLRIVPPPETIAEFSIDQLALTPENYPRVGGSTSTHPLGVVIAARALGFPYSWQQHFDGTRRPVLETSELELVHHGTHQSYLNLIAGDADLILVARLPSQDELDLAAERDVALEAQAIALDAFVFLLNPQNPLRSLTVEEIRGIYTGRVTNWRELGGLDARINPYQRNENSGSQELMERLVMKDLRMVDSPDLILMGMMGPINALTRDREGIGYSVHFFEEFMAPREEIKVCAIEDVLPGPESIATGRYPLTTEVYAVIRTDTGHDSTASQLRKWLVSSQGRTAIKESGYVPVPASL